ncbi:ATP-binding cassette domain-containing protein [candidate division GN15 bacterium]|nr:ATP-binding cassette domain-containing protein [candidate division GN15 bacterium]
MTDPGPIVQLDGVSFSYDGDPVLENVNLSIIEHDFAWIVGPNAGGKTTLVKLIIGLLAPDRGRVSLFGKSPQAARTMVGYMPQHAALDPRFPITAFDIVLMGRLGNRHPLGPIPKADRELAMEALAEVGLADKARTQFASLSGGQQRRLLVARALAGQPKLLLLDEPTANLDIGVEQELFELLQRLNERLTVVMVSHDPAFVSPFVKSVVCVNRTVHTHPTAEIDKDIMSELYGRPIRIIRHDRHFDREGGDA